MTILDYAEEAVKFFGHHRFDSVWMQKALRLLYELDFRDVAVQEFITALNGLENTRITERRLEIKKPVDGRYNHAVRRMAIDLMMQCISSLLNNEIKNKLHASYMQLSEEYWKYRLQEAAAKDDTVPVETHHRAVSAAGLQFSRFIGGK